MKPLEMPKPTKKSKTILMPSSETSITPSVTTATKALFTKDASIQNVTSVLSGRTTLIPSRSTSKQTIIETSAIRNNNNNNNNGDDKDNDKNSHHYEYVIIMIALGVTAAALLILLAVCYFRE